MVRPESEAGKKETETRDRKDVDGGSVSAGLNECTDTWRRERW